MSKTNYKRLGDYIREVENKDNTHFLRIDRVKHLVFLFFGCDYFHRLLHEKPVCYANFAFLETRC